MSVLEIGTVFGLTYDEILALKEQRDKAGDMTFHQDFVQAQKKIYTLQKEIAVLKAKLQAAEETLNAK